MAKSKDYWDREMETSQEDVEMQEYDDVISEGADKTYDAEEAEEEMPDLDADRLDEFEYGDSDYDDYDDYDPVG